MFIGTNIPEQITCYVYTGLLYSKADYIIPTYYCITKSMHFVIMKAKKRLFSRGGRLVIESDASSGLRQRTLQKVTTLTPAPDTDTPTNIVILRRPAPGVPQEQTGYTQLLGGGGGKEHINGIPMAFLLSRVADPDRGSDAF